MSEPLTNFEITLMKQRGWDTDKQHLLDEIKRMDEVAKAAELLTRELIEACEGAALEHSSFPVGERNWLDMVRVALCKCENRVRYRVR